MAKINVLGSLETVAGLCRKLDATHREEAFKSRPFRKASFDLQRLLRFSTKYDIVSV